MAFSASALNATHEDDRLHHDLAEFTTLTRPLLAADPIRHSLALTVLALLPGMSDAAARPPVLLSVRRADILAGAAVRLPPYDLIVSGLPAECAAAAVEVLAPSHQGLSGAVGPRSEAEAFAHRWSARTGTLAHERMAQRVFVLGQLTPPGGVRGAPRRADTGDLELLTRWREEFASEATGGLRGPGTARQQTRDSLAAGTAVLLWEIAGQPVAWASATAPVAGMSRLGPVYTPPRYRGHGYGSAVTTSAAGWARQAGAQHVVLITDLANPVSNAIYPRIGFRPVHDAVEIAFTLSPERGLAWLANVTRRTRPGDQDTYHGRAATLRSQGLGLVVARCER